jgi:hypothetical protein
VPLAYATSADLLARLQGDDDAATLPANAGRLLRAASAVVRRYTRAAWYATDADGYPTDERVRAAFRDATTIHAAALAAAGIDPDAPAGGRVIASKSNGPASVTYADADGEAAARGALLSRPVLEAAQVLDDLGLHTAPAVFG